MTELTTIEQYRAVSYDKFDGLYATKLKDKFKDIQPIINFDIDKDDIEKRMQEQFDIAKQMRINFNKFTNNLMDEEYINRHALLSAISDFKKSDTFLDSMLDYTWIGFEDMAWNYRPYQP